MITTTSVLLFATVALNAMSGMAAPIKVTRAAAEVHQVGRRHPQPIAADDLLKARSAAPVDPAPAALNRRFPRRVYYERYARGSQDESSVAARAPEPETPAPAVAARTPDRPLRSRKMAAGVKARSTTPNAVKKRNSKVGGTLSKKRSERAAPVSKKRSSKAAPAKKRSTKAPAKKRSIKSPSKKRSPKAKTVIAKKRNTSKTTLTKKSKVNKVAKRATNVKRNLITAAPTPVNKKRSTTGKTVKRSNNKKRSTSSKKRNNIKKRSNKAKNLKKRSPVPATLITTPDLRSLDVPSKNLEARHYKIVRVGGRKKSGCSHKTPEVEPCACACGCGQTANPATPPTGSVPPVDSAPGAPAPSGTVPDPAAGASGVASSSVPVPTATVEAKTPGAVGAVVPPAPVVPAAPVPSASGAVTPPPTVKGRSNKVLKNRSPRFSGARSQRRSSRGMADRRRR